MDRKGAGYTWEMLAGFFILMLVISFYAKDVQSAMGPVLIIMGAILVLGGVVSREPIMITAGLVLLAIAISYGEIVTK
jgi:hypothetical protein